MEQTLFKGHELIQCLTWSNRAHKNQQNAVLRLKIFSKSKPDFNFNVSYFGALRFENPDELDVTP